MRSAGLEKKPVLGLFLIKYMKTMAPWPKRQRHKLDKSHMVGLSSLLLWLLGHTAGCRSVHPLPGWEKGMPECLALFKGVASFCRVLGVDMSRSMHLESTCSMLQ